MNKQTDLSYSKIKIDNAKQDVKSFIGETKNENGIHLYLEGNEDIYVFLNGINVTLGEKAIYYDDFKVSADTDILKIVYSQKETENYSSEEIDYQLLYRVRLDKKYNVIKAIKNGKEVQIGVISGD